MPNVRRYPDDMNTPIDLGLRVDVDTYRGTKVGVPNLLRLLAKHGILATFFFCVGPDNMGRHLWRLMRPQFLWKMLRTRAASLYGWDILLRGTFGPGPLIGKCLAEVMQRTDQVGHEIGLHAWDHYTWQTHVDSVTPAVLRNWIEQGHQELTQILGYAPYCSAVPGWRGTPAVLKVKETFTFDFNSDCRGESCFWPVVGDQALSQAQIPVTLPTYDELAGCDDVTDANYNTVLIDKIRPGRLNVLTIHAEVEGIAKQTLFTRFLDLACERGIILRPLGQMVRRYPPTDYGRLEPEVIAGREGWVARQKAVTSKQESIG